MRSGSVFPWTCVLISAALALGSFQFVGERLAALESRPVEDPNRVIELERQVAELTTSLTSSMTAIHSLSRSAGRTVELSNSLRGLEVGLHETTCLLEEQRAWVARLQDLEINVGPRALEERFALFGASLDDRWRELGDIAARAEQMAGSARADLANVEREIAHDPERLWHDLLGPTVQVSGEETVGSGVLLASEPVPGTGEYATYVLTAWHVIRDLFAEPGGVPPEIPVTVYSPGKRVSAQTAFLVEHDADLDVALLRMRSTGKMDVGARLAPRERLDTVRVFERIYAVGCPLGNDPIPTYGEIADVDHLIDGQHYWMVSAPTYIGNSGGGIFDAETHELLALFTKIYTHGTVRPMVVPHMGLAIPLSSVYEWLERVGFAELEPKATDAQPTTAAAAR